MEWLRILEISFFLFSFNFKNLLVGSSATTLKSILYFSYPCSLMFNSNENFSFSLTSNILSLLKFLIIKFLSWFSKIIFVWLVLFLLYVLYSKIIFKFFSEIFLISTSKLTFWSNSPSLTSSLNSIKSSSFLLISRGHLHSKLAHFPLQSLTLACTKCLS